MYLSTWFAMAAAQQLPDIGSIETIVTNLGVGGFAIYLGYKLFLRLDRRIESLAVQLALEAKADREAHERQIDRLFDQFRDDYASILEQMRRLADDHMALTRETIISVKALETAVKELQAVVGKAS
jgi:hypothetical protein